MDEKEKVTQWLKNNTNLSWNRTPGDSPATKDDSNFINRGEAYEIRDMIVKYYNDYNKAFTDSNFAITYKKIINYKKGIKVTRSDMLTHLANN